MVKLTPYNIDLSTTMLSSEQTAVRSRGVHVSAIVDYISRTIGRRDNTFTQAHLDSFASIGRAFEGYMAQSVFPPPRYERVGELECDGIIGSPDAIDIEELSVMELKVRWHSSAKPIQEQREIFWQVMAYCHMLHTVKAVLVVLYVCGDWKPPVPTWPPRAWQVAFTPGELMQNWEMLRRQRDDMLRQGGGH